MKKYSLSMGTKWVVVLCMALSVLTVFMPCPHSSAEGGVSLEIDKDVYRVGEVIRARITIGPGEDGSSSVRHISWKIEDRKWIDPATGKVLYDGVGFEAGITPYGTLLYCLEEVPGIYDITLVSSDGTGDLSEKDIRDPGEDMAKSGTVTIKVLPGGSR